MAKIDTPISPIGDTPINPIEDDLMDVADMDELLDIDKVLDLEAELPKTSEVEMESSQKVDVPIADMMKNKSMAKTKRMRSDSDSSDEVVLGNLRRRRKINRIDSDENDSYETMESSPEPGSRVS